MLNIQVISVGDELLCGNTANTNLLFIGGRLAAHGYRVAGECCIPDTREAIFHALSESKDADIVILTGGLGPTKDDMTRPTTAEFLHRPLVFHPEIRAGILAYLGERGKKMPPEAAEVQSMVPEGGVPLKNQNGTAPGLLMTDGAKMWALLPGPPRELRPMFENELLPRILEKYAPLWREISLHALGLGESIVEDTVRKALGADLSRFHLAYCIKEDNVEIRVGALRGTQEDADLEKAVATIRQGFGTAALPEDCNSAIEYLAKLLREKGWTLATAESCTGGGIATRCTDLPGSSDWFLGGFVTYANSWKEQLLGVRKETLESHGAVSAETVSEMLDGVLQKTNADLAVAVSGIAGPGGGTPEKPVGTVFIGTAWRDGKNIQEFHIHGLRDTVRARTISYATAMLINSVLKQ